MVNGNMVNSGICNPIAGICPNMDKYFLGCHQICYKLPEVLLSFSP